MRKIYTAKAINYSFWKQLDSIKNNVYKDSVFNYGIKKTFSQGFLASTNNRMDLRGPIKALSMIPEGSNVTLYSDSSYLSNPFNKNWIETWLKTDWKKGTIKNIDLWKELSEDEKKLFYYVQYNDKNNRLINY